MALVESACHGRVVGRGIHDESADQAFENFGLLKSVADRSRIGGTGAVDGVNDPVDSVVAEQTFGFHADAVFLDNALTEGLCIGRVEADTGDIQAAFQSALCLAGELIIDSYLGTVIGNYAVDKLGVKNAALFTIAGNTNSESIGSFIRDAINAKGANIVADEQCQEGDVDFRAQLTNIKAKNPDIIFVVMNDYAKNATFAKQAREMGIECTLMGHDGWDSAQLASEAQGALEGCCKV